MAVPKEPSFFPYRKKRKNTEDLDEHSERDVIVLLQTLSLRRRKTKSERKRERERERE